MSSSFSPQRAAELHNQLVDRAIEHASMTTEQTLVARFLEYAADALERDPDLIHHPLAEFLSLLRVTPLSSGFEQLTPEVFQPAPGIFWSDMFTTKPEYVLLHPMTYPDAPMDGGLFIDLGSCRVCWNETPYAFPPRDRWVPIEVVYRKWLEHYQSGRYFWDQSAGQLEMKPRAEGDLAEALEAWLHLLSAIEARIPGACPGHLEPLRAQSLAPFKLATFARDFLAQAPRPGFRWVAPGLSTFSPATLAEIYEAEDPESSRNSLDCGFDDGGEWSSLVLPCGEAVGPEPKDSTFDKDHGFGKFTLSRQAGLYLDPADPYADTVRLVCPSGSTEACQFTHPCPWGPNRSTRLVEILQHWTALVTDGTWTVDENGVSCGKDWFDENVARASLDWEDFYETTDGAV